MRQLSPSEASSYAGATASIAAGLTLTQWGVIVGIITALLTFILNAIFMYRRDRREQIESTARLAVLEEEQHEHP